MRAFHFEEELVAAYWRRLARSIDPASTGKGRKSSSQVRAGVRQDFTTSRNVDPAIPTRRARASRLTSGAHQRRKINPTIPG